MKKILAGIIVLLIIAVLGLPFAKGWVAEQQYRKTINEINDNYAKIGLDTKVEITRYTKGYASSEIEWRLNLGKMKAVYGVEEILFYDQMEHGWNSGLTEVVSRTNLVRNTWYKEFIAKKLDGKDPHHITNTYSQNGTITSSVIFDACTFTQDNQSIRLKPGQITMIADQGFKHFRYQGTWEGMMVDKTAQINKVTLQSDLQRISPFVWAGNASFAVTDIRGEKEGEPPFSIAGFTINVTSQFNKNENTLSGLVEYGADSAAMGPQKVDKPFLGLALSGINAQGYEQFMQQYMVVIQTVMKDMEETQKGDSEQAKKALEQRMKAAGMQLLTAGEKLLTKGLRFDITDVHCTLAEGEISGKLNVWLNKDMTLAQFAPLLEQPAQALKIFSFRSWASLPEQLVSGTPQLFEPAFPGMKTGVFVIKDKRAEHRAEIKDGKLLLNDIEI